MFPRLLRLKLIDCFLSILDLFIDVVQVLIWCHFLTFVEFYILAKYFVKEMISKYEVSKVLCIFRAWKLNKHFDSIILCSKALQILFICYRWHWTYYSCSDTYMWWFLTWLMLSPWSSACSGCWQAGNVCHDESNTSNGCFSVAYTSLIVCIYFSVGWIISGSLIKQAWMLELICGPLI